jgi:hypothetical protein
MISSMTEPKKKQAGAPQPGGVDFDALAADGTDPQSGRSNGAKRLRLSSLGNPRTRQGVTDGNERHRFQEGPTARPSIARCPSSGSRIFISICSDRA